MAIEAIGVAHSDLEVRGGLKNIGIAEFNDMSAVTFDADGDLTDHLISAMTVTGMKLFELKQGTGSLSTAGTKEGGTILFEHTVSFYIPNCSNAHMAALHSLMNKNLVVIVQSFAGENFVVGASNEYALSDDIANVQMYARMTSVEGGTGAALGDENGVTVTIAAQSGELPRLFTGTFTPDPSEGTVTVA